MTGQWIFTLKDSKHEGESAQFSAGILSRNAHFSTEIYISGNHPLKKKYSDVIVDARYEKIGKGDDRALSQAVLMVLRQMKQPSRKPCAGSCKGQHRGIGIERIQGS